MINPTQIELKILTPQEIKNKQIATEVTDATVKDIISFSIPLGFF